MRCRAPWLVRWVTWILWLLFVAGHAWGADPRAESLFQEALALMKDGQFAEACPKLRASQDIESKSGTLIMLANCHEQVGKTASAWAEYKEAATLARTEGRQENSEKATELAHAIEPKVSKLTIAVPELVAGLVVTLDDTAVLPGTHGTPVAVDPGEHRVVARAPGHVEWSVAVVVGADADQQTVTVPLLERQPEPPPSPPPSAVRPAPAAPPPASATAAGAAPPAPPDEDAGVPAWAWVSGGVGVALLVAAVVFRADQSDAAGELDSRCGEDRTACPPDYDFQSDRDREQRDFGLFIGLGAAGLVGVGAAIIGMVTAEDSTARSAAAWSVVPWGRREAAGGSLRVRF